MIVKDIARAKPTRGKTVSAGAAQRAKTRVIVGILRYVTADDLGLERTPEVGTTKKERAYEQSLTTYLLTEKPAAHERAGELVACWSGEEEIGAEEFLERSLFAMANIDPSHFRHHVFSERHADVELVARARGGHGKDRPWARGVTVDELMSALRDLYGEHAGIMVVEHIDTDHRHFHVIVVTVDPESGKGFQINDGFDRDALHMLAARIDFETGAQSEPNALFVADEAGIHDRWTGRLIADLTLKIDGKATQAVRYQRSKLMDQNDALDKAPGWRERVEEALDLEQPLPEAPAWDDERIAKIMACPRITSARSWHELHVSLASIGIAYEPIGGGARLDFGDGSHIKATAAVSTASLTELERRIGPFEPRDESVGLRPFVRPTYTMVKSEELLSEHRAAARKTAKAEREKIKAKRLAVEAAIEAEEECEEQSRRDALRRLYDIEQAALDDWRPPRRPHERRQPPRQADECEEAIIWSDRAARFSSLASVKMHYTRQHVLGMVTWSRNGRTDIYEHRRRLSIQPKADKRQALRLAHFKWGHGFELLCSRRELYEYTRLAAEEGIYFGDTEQHARIRVEREALSRKLGRREKIAVVDIHAATPTDKDTAVRGDAALPLPEAAGAGTPTSEATLSPSANSPNPASPVRDISWAAEQVRTGLALADMVSNRLLIIPFGVDEEHEIEVPKGLKHIASKLVELTRNRIEEVHKACDNRFVVVGPDGQLALTSGANVQGLAFAQRMYDEEQFRGMLRRRMQKAAETAWYVEEKRRGEETAKAALLPLQPSPPTQPIPAPAPVRTRNPGKKAKARYRPKGPYMPDHSGSRENT